MIQRRKIKQSCKAVLKWWKENKSALKSIADLLKILLNWLL
jgi:hypothetical protein